LANTSCDPTISFIADLGGLLYDVAHVELLSEPNLASVEL
jgi:hypothetical protein